MSGAQTGNDFWKFSLRIYRAPGVADECIAVQDTYDVDVNLLLFCAWLGSERRIVLSIKDLEACRSAVNVWHERTVRPMRAARRAMKGLSDAEDIRNQVKKLELEAERREQLTLFAFARKHWPTPGAASPREAARANLDLFLRAHGAPGVDIVPMLLGTIEKVVPSRAAFP